MRDRTKPLLSEIHTIVFDFDGVFTDNRVYVDQNGNESVVCNRADGLGLDVLRSFISRGHLNADIFILSKETNKVVAARAQKLEIDYNYGVSNKLDFINKYLQEKFPLRADPFTGLVYLGNDINDFSVMIRSGYSVAPSDAHPLVKEAANLILPNRGGEGFVRAFIEFLLDFENLSWEEIDDIISNC